MTCPVVAEGPDVSVVALGSLVEVRGCYAGSQVVWQLTPRAAVEMARFLVHAARVIDPSVEVSGDPFEG